MTLLLLHALGCLPQGPRPEMPPGVTPGFSSWGIAGEPGDVLTYRFSAEPRGASVVRYWWSGAPEGWESVEIGGPDVTWTVPEGAGEVYGALIVEGVHERRSWHTVVSIEWSIGGDATTGDTVGGVDTGP